MVVVDQALQPPVVLVVQVVAEKVDHVHLRERLILVMETLDWQILVVVEVETDPPISGQETLEQADLVSSSSHTPLDK